jgi:hypothetical protein
LKKQEKHGMPRVVIAANTTISIKPCNKEKNVVNLPMVEHRYEETDPNMVSLDK